MVWPDSVRYAILGGRFWSLLQAGEWDLWTSPGYPFFLYILAEVLHDADHVALVQHVLAVVTTLLVWASLRSCYRSPLAALGGGLAVALSPAQHYYAGCLLTENLSAFLVSLSIFLLVAANTASFKKMLAWRFLAGVAMGASILTRPNLVAGVVPSMILPLTTRQGEFTKRRYSAAVLITLLAVVITYVPWGQYNARRGLYSPQGNVGWQFHAFANSLGVGKPYHDLAFLQVTPRMDQELKREAVARMLANPKAYLKAVSTTSSYLLGIEWQGDTAPHVESLTVLDLSHELPVFTARPYTKPRAWRITMSKALSGVYQRLLPFAWAGLLVFLIRSMRGKLWGNIAVAAFPLSCLLSLAVILQANTRYSFPLEPLVLGFGLLAFVARLKEPASPGSVADESLSGSRRPLLELPRFRSR